jgi:fumarate reductase flavoprotein subunit
MTGADVIVVGAGLAGLTAGVRAAEAGLDVVVLEKGPHRDYSCNTRISGGVMVVAGRSASSPAAELSDAIEQTSFGATRPELRELLARGAGPAIEWLRTVGAVFVEQTFGPGMVFREVLSPTGLDSTGVDWAGRGPDQLLGRLADRLVGAGGRFELGSEARRLLIDGGRISGVEVSRSGRPVLHEAGAVVLADGGFQGDPDLVAAHIAPTPELVVRRCAASGTGWGLRAAAAAGAELVEVDCFYGHLLSRDALHNDRLWPYPVLDPVAERGIVVDRHGHRFADEGLGGVELANRLARRTDPTAFVIGDEPVWRGTAAASVHPPPVNPNLEANGGRVHWAPSLDLLARTAGIEPLGLLETVERHRALVEHGVADPVHPRTLPTGLRMYGGPAPGQPSGLRSGPFFAIPVVAGISFTMGGPLIDGSARVLHRAGHPIPGLYAAGATAAGFEGGETVGYVGGLVRSVVTAAAAIDHIRSYPTIGPRHAISHRTTEATRDR